MRQPIGFEQAELDRLANTATELCQWLEQQPFGATESDARSQQSIPPRLTAIAAILVVYGGPIVLGGSGTEGLCWAGGCMI
jgi:hypothetical protein